MAGIFDLDGKVFNLKLGKSFENDGDVAYHSIRYDFKPASIDTSKDASLTLGESNQVTVTVPHVESSGMPHTVFRGNKRPSQKECILIIDHTTGEVTLEKLSYSMQVKSTRMKGGNSRPKQDSPAHPVTLPVTLPPQQDKPKMPTSLPKASTEPQSEAKTLQQERICGSLSASSSSDSDMSDDSSNDDSDEESGPMPNAVTEKPTYQSMLSQDLILSDTDESD